MLSLRFSLVCRCDLTSIFSSTVEVGLNLDPYYAASVCLSVCVSAHVPSSKTVPIRAVINIDTDRKTQRWKSNLPVSIWPPEVAKTSLRTKKLRRQYLKNQTR